MLNHEELLLWEEEQLLKDHGRYCAKKNDRLFDPCKERLFKRRSPKWYRCLETPANRKKWQGHVRTMNRNIHEESLHPTKHEYHTGGWLTW